MQLNFTYYSLKKCLLGLVLLTCLVGTFKKEILEISHSLSHHFGGSHSYHSHHAHGGESDHVHIILNVTRAALERVNDSPDLQNKNQQSSIDKSFPICISQDLQTNFSRLKNKSIPTYNQKLPSNAFLEIIIPPPDFTS